MKHSGIFVCRQAIAGWGPISSTSAAYDSVSPSLLSKLNKLLRLLNSLQEKLLTLEADLKTTTINPADYQSYPFFPTILHIFATYSQRQVKLAPIN